MTRQRQHSLLTVTAGLIRMQGYAGELDERASSRYTPEMLEGADKMNLDAQCKRDTC